MEELLKLFNHRMVTGVIVAVNFIQRRVLSCKERAHAGFDFKCDTDEACERSEVIDM